jgi:hypothetical protein
MPNQQDSILSTFSSGQIEELRNAIVRRDSQQAKEGMIDINNPPKVPYVFQKFPMMVYKHSKAQSSRDELRQNRDQVEIVHIPAKLGEKVVNSEEELEAALEAGYSEKPPLPVHVGIDNDKDEDDGELVEHSHQAHSRKRKIAPSVD